jgi:hypothetical protein
MKISKIQLKALHSNLKATKILFGNDKVSMTYSPQPSQDNTGLLVFMVLLLLAGTGALGYFLWTSGCAKDSVLDKKTNSCVSLPECGLDEIIDPAQYKTGDTFVEDASKLCIAKKIDGGGGGGGETEPEKGGPCGPHGDDDCRKDEICCAGGREGMMCAKADLGKCVPKPVQPTQCKKDEECPSDQVCAVDFGVCTPGTRNVCKTTDDCPPDKICVNGKCDFGKRACKQDSDCPQGLGVAGAACASDGFCYGLGHARPAKCAGILQQIFYPKSSNSDADHWGCVCPPGVDAKNKGAKKVADPTSGQCVCPTVGNVVTTDYDGSCYSGCGKQENKLLNPDGQSCRTACEPGQKLVRKDPFTGDCVNICEPGYIFEPNVIDPTKGRCVFSSAACTNPSPDAQSPYCYKCESVADARSCFDKIYARDFGKLATQTEQEAYCQRIRQNRVPSQTISPQMQKAEWDAEDSVCQAFPVPACESNPPSLEYCGNCPKKAACYSAFFAKQLQQGIACEKLLLDYGRGPTPAFSQGYAAADSAYLAQDWKVVQQSLQGVCPPPPPAPTPIPPAPEPTPTPTPPAPFSCTNPPSDFVAGPEYCRTNCLGQPACLATLCKNPPGDATGLDYCRRNCVDGPACFAAYYAKMVPPGLSSTDKAAVCSKLRTEAAGLAAAGWPVSKSYAVQIQLEKVCPPTPTYYPAEKYYNQRFASSEFDAMVKTISKAHRVGY